MYQYVAGSPDSVEMIGTLGPLSSSGRSGRDIIKGQPHCLPFVLHVMDDTPTHIKFLLVIFIRFAVYLLTSAKYQSRVVTKL